MLSVATVRRPADLPLLATLEDYKSFSLDAARSACKASVQGLLGQLPRILWGQQAEGGPQLGDLIDDQGYFLFKVLGTVAPDTVMKYVTARLTLLPCAE